MLRPIIAQSQGKGNWHNGPDACQRSFEIGSAVLFDGMAAHAFSPQLEPFN
jgi:hypothetical protein